MMHKINTILLCKHLGFHTGLLLELISCILDRLDPVQIMLGADKVCRQELDPLLEELELSNCRQAQHEGVFQAIAKECPRLRCLRNHRVKSLYYYGWDLADDGEAMAIAEMHELRSLQLLNNDLSNQGLAAILDKCLHLEWLDVRECRHLRMDPQLQARIGATKLVTKYMDEERENMEPGSPNTECSTCLNYLEPDKERYRRKRCVDDVEDKVISTVY